MGCEASQHETRSVDSQSGRRRRRTTTHTAPLGLLLRKYNPTIPIMIGRVERSSTPHLHGKWAESPEYTKRYGEYYPPWAFGSAGHVISRPIADYIATAPPSKLSFWQGEDVSIGVWLYDSPLEVIFVDAPGEFFT